MNTKLLEIRNDDVLQILPSSKNQRGLFNEKNPFRWFFEADQIFKKYNYPCTLAVLSEGIEIYPEWVDYIRENQWRYKIELHGSSHLRYKNMPADEGYRDLAYARNYIEKTFNCKISTWYVPFGRKNVPDWGDEVCESLKIKMDTPKFKCLPKYYGQKGRDQINFHYWSPSQVNKIEQIIKKECQKFAKQ